MRAEQLFSDCWDDELSVAEREDVQSHLTACARCRAEYDAFAQTMQAVHSLPRFAAASDFTDQVLARALAAEAERQPARFAPRTWRWSLEWRWQPALAAAAAVAVVAGGVWVGTLQRPPSGHGSDSQLASRAATLPPATPAAGEEKVSAPPAGAAEAVRVPEQKVASVNGATAARPVIASLDVRQGGSRQDAESVTGEPAGIATAGPKLSAESSGVFPDSLIDHTYDVEFAFEPVNLRPVAGGSKVAPARPTPTSEVGRRANITF